jgi:hypothetical protein
MGIFAYFVLNNEYVAKVLCENKNRPQLHCNGQCYLAKKLKAAEQQERQNIANLLKVKEIKLFCFSADLPSFPCFFFHKDDKKIAFYSEYFSSPSLSGIFHPPQI